MLSTLLMNIVGSEWIILILLGVILVFGPKRLPQFSRNLGRAVGEYEKARQMFQKEITDAVETANGMKKIPLIKGPVSTEREKLETIASSLGIEGYISLSDDDLRNLIAKRMTS